MEKKRMMKMRRVFGVHYIVELCGCDAAKLDNIEFIKECLLSAAKKANATVLGHKFHKFCPQGVSGIVLVAESHISIHTWPEHNYASVDIYTCGSETLPYRAVKEIRNLLGSKNIKVMRIERGIPESFREDNLEV